MDRRDLRALDGGGAGSDAAPGAGGTDLADELRKALVNGDSGIDYEQFRAELDAVADPAPKDWWAWAERTDRHIRRGALEQD